ncbi:MAG TPA: chitinase [Pirellulales bacterium]|nr:chitinase [Pirellulales bacterium]
MFEMPWELAVPEAKAQPKKSGGRTAANRTRSTRLRLESLEDRLVCSGTPAGTSTPLDTSSAVGEAGDASSEVMQASQMSAFYQQSALFSTGLPTSNPTVTWAPPRDDRPAPVLMPIYRVSEQFDTFDKLAAADREKDFGLLPLLPNHDRVAGGKARFGLRDPFERTWPSQVFAPYVDMDTWPTFDLVHAAETQDLKYFQLAFIAADSQNLPSWGGQDDHGIGGEFDLALRRQVSDLRSIGGDVGISFGGPRRLEIAQVIIDVQGLEDAYRGVIDAYQLTRIDFDIEASALDDVASIERRSEAMSRLQHDMAAEGRKLQVWFTLPADASGLSPAGQNVIDSALRHGVDLGGVNVKPTKAANQAGVLGQSRMGISTIESTISVFYQLQSQLGRTHTSAEIWRKVGVTPVVGQGEAAGENFLPTDGRELYDFARQQGLGMIGIWSINRDQYDSTGQAPAGELSSGVEQKAFEFSDIFQPFTAP